MNGSETLFDSQVTKQKYSEDVLKLIQHVREKYNKKPLDIVSEFWKLSRGDGKLSIQDYFLYQLYDNSKYSFEEKKRFISDRLHWKIAEKCCDMSWQGITEDKWIAYNLLEKFDIPIPKSVAVIEPGIRQFPNIPNLRNPGDLKEFLESSNLYPIYGKPIRGIGSFGSFIITGTDGSKIKLAQEEDISFELFFEKIIGSRSYLLQEQLQNHALIKGFSKYLATVRTLNMVRENDILTPFTLIKIPSPTSIADNYWRSGNMMADIDPATGITRRAVTGKGIDLKEIEEHPETKARLVDLQLPDWQKLLKLNEKCAAIFAPVGYQSLDIALTNSGPVVVEVNLGGGFDLPQLASGSGFLTDEVAEYFKQNGWKFRKN